MGKRIDIAIGDKFLTFSVIDIEKKYSRKYGRRLLVLQCLCGFKKKIDIDKRDSLSPCQFCSIYSVVGSRNGKLTFLSYKGKSLFKAQCDCGNECTVRKRSVSCGCHLLENDLKNAHKLIGLTFGYLKLIKVIGFKEKGIYFQAKCKCGNLTEIRNGSFQCKKSCGCLQKEKILRGSQVSNSKHTEKEIEAIKELFVSGVYSLQELSCFIGTDLASLKRILRGQSWKHVKINQKILNENKDKMNEILSLKKTGIRYDYPSLIGQKKGSNTFIKFFKEKGKNVKSLIRCDCGYERIICPGPLLRGSIKFCPMCYHKNKNQ